MRFALVRLGPLAATLFVAAPLSCSQSADPSAKRSIVTLRDRNGAPAIVHTIAGGVHVDRLSGPLPVIRSNHGDAIEVPYKYTWEIKVERDLSPPPPPPPPLESDGGQIRSLFLLSLIQFAAIVALAALVVISSREKRHV